MPKFNPNKEPLKPDTTNYEGAPAYTLTPKAELVKMSAVAFLEDKFYEKAEDKMTRIRQIIKDIITKDKDPEFVLRVAAYSRKEFWLRSFPVMLLAEASFYEQSNSYIRKYAKHILTRADMPLELLSYIISCHGDKKRIRKQIKFAVNDAANRFDGYQFGKYKSTGKALSWKDAMKICHPVAKDDEQNKIFKAVIDETIREEGTWESAKSAGKDWKFILQNFNVGYMALLRNLRNMLNDKSVGESQYNQVLNTIKNPVLIKKSRQFPFRFLSAYREIDPASATSYRSGSKFETGILRGAGYTPAVIETLSALATATEISMDNIPTLPGSTVIACDVSGSMDSRISEKSKITCNNIGAVLGAGTLLKNPASLFYIFGENIENIPYMVGRPLFDTINYVATGGDRVSHATNGYKVIDDLIIKQYPADRIIIFTDEQLWDSDNRSIWGSDGTLKDSMKKYWKEINSKTKLIVVDLCGYSGSMFPEKYPNVIRMGGYNDKMLRFIEIMEQESSNMFKVIDKYQFD